MDSHNGMLVKLIGGPLDGETYALQPRGSVSIPQAFRFFTAHNGAACWADYETMISPARATWDGIKEGEELAYRFSGYVKLDI